MKREERRGKRETMWCVINRPSLLSLTLQSTSSLFIVVKSKKHANERKREEVLPLFDKKSSEGREE